MRAAAHIAESHARQLRLVQALIVDAITRVGERWIPSSAVAEALVCASLEFSARTGSAARTVVPLPRLDAAVEETPPTHHSAEQALDSWPCFRI